MEQLPAIHGAIGSHGHDSGASGCASPGLNGASREQPLSANEEAAVSPYAVATMQTEADVESRLKLRAAERELARKYRQQKRDATKASPESNVATSAGVSVTVQSTISMGARPSNKRAYKFTVPVQIGAPVKAYHVDDHVLGKGSFGEVRKGVHRQTQEVRAIKSILKSRMDREELDAEIEIMKILDHPNVLRLYEVFEDQYTIYLCTELLSGGELFHRILEERNFNERQAARVMQQIVGGLLYLHLHWICHRDLKPENFLLQSPSPVDECKIKIIDFGTAVMFDPSVQLTERIGTPFYVAPEVLLGAYDQNCDLWSSGVIMFVLIAGELPFNGKNVDEIAAKVLEGHYTLCSHIWSDVSNDGKELVQWLLTKNVDARCSAPQAAAHTWIKDHAPAAKDAPLQATTLGSMRHFCGQNKLKKEALNIIAHNLPEDQIQQLAEMFATLDKDGDGTVTFQELAEGVNRLDNPAIFGDLSAMMKEMDVDGNGSVDYTEFLAATMDQRQCAEERQCWAAFHVFDADGSGTITRKELEQVLADDGVGQMFGNGVVAQVLEECDQDGDGEITFDEFVSMMRGDARKCANTNNAKRSSTVNLMGDRNPDMRNRRGSFMVGQQVMPPLVSPST